MENKVNYQSCYKMMICMTYNFARLSSGSNGRDYMFLLKGHEDLRQDERVMQLFGLVNTLLLNDPDTFRRNLTIQVSISDMLILYSAIVYFSLHQLSFILFFCITVSFPVLLALLGMYCIIVMVEFRHGGRWLLVLQQNGMSHGES
jgi:hypothetical protein